MDKYYTPSIEEFHVGFEYQSLGDPRIPEKDESWSNEVMTEEHFPNFLFYWKSGSDSEWRVKYLDSEDIESLGWRIAGEVEWRIGDWMLTEYKNNEVCIENCQVTSTPTYMVIKIRNKSELRLVMKMLGINSPA